MLLFNSVDPFVTWLNLEWLSSLTIWAILVRLILACLCGGLIGLERAKKHHAAGLRTYILVCVGSAIAMITNQFIGDATGIGDYARLGAQVISGIGFLGAGTILVTSRNQIRGLTTAAGLWACACLGLAIGIGFYTLAVCATLIVLIVLTVLPKIEFLSTTHSKSMEIHIEFEKRENLKEFVNYVRSFNLQINSIEHNQAYSSSGLSVYTIYITSKFESKTKLDHVMFLQLFSELQYVNYVEEIK